MIFTVVRGHIQYRI